MKPRSMAWAVVSSMLVAACATGSPTAIPSVSSATQPAATPTPVAVAPSSTPSAQPSVVASASVQKVTLHIVTVEPEDSPEGKAIAFFRDDVARRSGGSIVVVAASAFGENDQDNIRTMLAGGIDGAVVQARNWDEFGVTSMQALQVPFLITTDALAKAVTTGDVADDLMSGLQAKGVDGLAMWPIDLRHPVSFGAPLVSPASFKGTKIRIVGSTINEQVIRALGAEPVGVYDDTVRGGESAYDRAYSLPGPGTFSGNVTFYPRVDVFVMTSAGSARLSSDQRDAVRASASATRDHVVGGIVPDAEQASDYCVREKGAVVLATANQLADFGRALQPVEDTIAADSVNSELIAAIRTLGATMPIERPAQACAKPK